MKNIIKLCMIVTMSLLVACDDKPAESTEQATATNIYTATLTEPSVDESKLPLHRVATVNTYPPFATKDEIGIITGFDIDVLKAIAKYQGFRVEFVVRPWEDWKEDLNAKKEVDIWAAGISIKNERKQFTDFSAPYMDYNTVVIKREDTPSIVSQGNTGNYTIGVEQNTSDVIVAKSLVKNPQQVHEFPSNFIAIESLLQKKIDGVVGNEMVLAHIIQSFPEYQFKSEILKNTGREQKQLGFMVRKGNPELLKQINQGLETIKANGEFDKIKQKWFGDLVK